MNLKAATLSACLVCAANLPGMGAAKATTVTIQSTDAIFNYAGVRPMDGFSTQPTTTSITAGPGQVLTFSSVTGTVNLTESGPYAHGPDGGPSSPPGSNPVNVLGAAGLSGSIASVSAPLFGVFLNGHETDPGHIAPATLSYLSPSDFTFASASPLDDQVFFIGDGLTGTGTGATQIFNVPVDATGLVLGIVDAQNYFGVPGAYFDNAGSFTATFSLSSAVPEPSTWAMMILGFAGIGFMAYRRKSKPILMAA
jgi:hypothetical protein